jgi:hypothetical protein
LSSLKRENFAKSAIFRRVVLTIAILTIIDVAVGGLSDLLQSINLFYGKSSLTIASDLAFTEGAVAFFIGSLLALLSSGLKLREKAMMIIGVSMIGISVVFGIFT